LTKRIAEHEQKTFKCYTSSRLPVKLVFCNEFLSREDTLAREQQIKKWSRRKKKALIEQDWIELIKHSKRKTFNTSTG